MHRSTHLVPEDNSIQRGYILKWGFLRFHSATHCHAFPPPTYPGVPLSPSPIPVPSPVPFASEGSRTRRVQRRVCVLCLECVMLEVGSDSANMVVFGQASERTTRLHIVVAISFYFILDRLDCHRLDFNFKILFLFTCVSSFFYMICSTVAYRNFWSRS
jgi:hypothetical protein